MKITAKNGKSNKIHVSVDGEYSLTVDADYWYSCGVHEGDELSEAELESFRIGVLSRRAYNAAVNLLSVRDYGAKELTRKLIAKGHEQGCAQAAVERLCGQGYINDESYAFALTKHLAERKGMSAQKVKSELISRGISSEIARNAAESIDKDAVSRIIELLQSKYARYSQDDKERKRAYSALLRLGYRHGDINTAMRAVDTDFEPEEF